MRGLPADIDGIIVQQQDGTLYAWTKTAIFSSRDHGQTWTRLPDLP